MKVQQIHHVAYRCKDAKQTVDFYKKVLNMELLGAIAEDRVPSTKAPDPYMQMVAHDMVEEWSRTKSPPRHTAWLHEKELATT